MGTKLFWIGIALATIGGVWVSQGIGALKGSFMTGNPYWFWVGAGCVVVGAILVAVELFRR